jgi:anti-sigma factor RsiW
MTCPPEWRLSAYVDGGLDAAGAKPLELHLVSCARCRRRVVALRDEARVLRDLVHERLPAPAAPADAGRGIALGLPVATAALALVSFGAGALVESVPRPFRWFAPTEELGVMNMLVDLAFAVRNNFAAWFDFAFALAALAAVAAVAYLAADALARRARTAGRAAALLLALCGAAALAERAHAEISIRQSDEGEVRVGADERIDGSLVAMGESVTIDGEIAGDLLAFGKRVQIGGKVEGNLFCAGRDVEITGSVTGSVHCAGMDVRASSAVGGNFYGAGQDVALEAESRVGGDVALAFEDGQLEGEIARDVIGAGEDLTVAGRVGRDATFHVADVTFLETAVVPGRIELHMPEGEEPTIAAGAALGSIERQVLEGGAPRTPLKRISQFEFVRRQIVLIVSAFLVGIVLFALAPGMFSARVETAGRFFGAVGMGMLALIALFVGGCMIAMTFVGAPVAVLLFIAMALLIFVGPIAVAAIVGRTVMRSGLADFREFAIALGVGLILLGILISLPVVGVIATIVLVLEGVGLLTFEALDWWSERRAARAAAA